MRYMKHYHVFFILFFCALLFHCSCSDTDTETVGDDEFSKFSDVNSSDIAGSVGTPGLLMLPVVFLNSSGTANDWFKNGGTNSIFHELLHIFSGTNDSLDYKSWFNSSHFLDDLASNPEIDPIGIPRRSLGDVKTMLKNLKKCYENEMKKAQERSEAKNSNSNKSDKTRSSSDKTNSEKKLMSAEDWQKNYGW